MTRVLFLGLLFACTSICRAQQTIDVVHYRFEITLSDLNDTVYGKAVIRFKAILPVNNVVFDLAGLNKNRGMLVTSVALDATGQPADFEQANNKLTLRFSQDVHTGDTAAVTITYKGIPSDGLIISRNKYGHRTFFADNWPNRGHNWIPCVDDPADKASVEFIVTAPAHYQVVSNGIQVEETNTTAGLKRTHWKEDVPVSTKVMVIGAADFAVGLSGTVNNCIPVTTWVYPEDRDNGFYDFATAGDILTFFINNIGPYGYKKLANVQSKTTFGGLENANTIFYNESTVDGMRQSEKLLAHEIAHQWFGNMATEKSFAHLWLSEGFATYLAIFYLEKKYGIDTALFLLEEDRREVIAFSRTNTRPVVDGTSNYMELLNANSYQKGSWVLHMLRRELGDSVFFRSVRSYYSAYAGKNADTRDLQKIFEKVSGKNLSSFFDQWLYAPGLPRLEISWKYDATEKKTSIAIRQLQDKPFFFPLQIEIRGTNGSKQLHTLTVSRKEQTFSVPSREKTLSVTADPKKSLLFESLVRQ